VNSLLKFKQMKIIPFIIILITACSFSIVSVEESGGGKRSDKQTINVMTYNIRMNTTADGVNAWPLRKEKVIELLKFHQADLFGVQEALPEQVEDLVAGFPEFDHVGVGRDDGISKGEHMCIFYRKSRFEKMADGNFWLSETPDKPGLGWDAACNRTCTWIKLKDKVTGKVLFHFNTHLDHRGSTARLEGAKLILQRIADLNRQILPLILTGDFNSTKSEEPIKAIMQVLADSREKCKTTPYGPEGTSGGFDVKPMSKIIDYIFTNVRVKILRHGILTDSWGLYYPSDHLPVLSEILIE
jgi:endonuclease/exonuclease/phosphatase family metal-dependent hydrolase